MDPSSAKTIVGDYIDRTTLEEVVKLLGHEPADVLEVTMTPDVVTVHEQRRRGQQRTFVTYRHVIR